MNRSTLVLGILVGVAPSAWAQVRSAPAPVTAERIDSMVSAQAAADVFSGVVLVANRSGIVYQRAVGMADRAHAAPMALGTRLQIASMTKLFTQIAIRQLEQAGKLSLADTVGKFLPRYPNPVVRSRVTIDQLLHHRSGVGSFWNQRFMATRGVVRSVQDYMELFQDDSLLFEPGTSEAYSNGGYVLLGAIVERVSGQSYHDYLREHVFSPAGMTDTRPFDSRVSLNNAAIGYTTMTAGPIAGDSRLAGTGPRPGYATPSGSTQPGGSEPHPAGDSAGSGGMRLRIIGPDGKELTPDEAREAMARRAAGGGSRHPNVDFQAGMSSPAGDHFSTVGDLLKLADALRSSRLLDSTRTAAVLGSRYAAGGDFRANGGGPGVNAEFSVYPSGEVIVVLSNYDPPAATDVAQYIRSLVEGR